MHRSIYGVFVLGLLANAACGGDEPPPKTPETSATTTAPPATETAPPPATETAAPPVAPKPSLADLEKQAGMTIMEAFNAHDSKKLGSVYADNAIFRMAGAPSDSTGPDAIAAGAQKLFDSISNMKAATANVFVKNDVVVIVWQMAGTHSGDFFGVKATEKPVGWTGASVMWFNDDGKIKEEHVYYDVGTVMAQIGAAPKGMKARAIPALAASPTITVSTGSDTESKNLDLVKGWAGAFEQKTPDAFLALVTDDTTWDDLASPGPMKGTKVAKQYFGDMKKAFPDVKEQISNAWAFGDFVATENVMTGTNNGAFMGKPATKKAINLHGLDIVQMKDGKVLNGWSFMNGGELGMQLGWIKMPGDKKDDAAKSAPPAKAATPATPAKK